MKDTGNQPGNFLEPATLGAVVSKLFDAWTPPVRSGNALNSRRKKEEFVKAVATAGGRKVTPRTVGNWLKGTPPQQPETFDAIEKVLYGGNPPEDNPLRAAWDAHQTARPADAARRPRGGNDSTPPQAAAAADLVPAKQRRMAKLPLGDMTVEIAPQGSSADDFGVIIDLRPGADSYDGQKVSAVIRPVKITVRYEETGCQPVYRWGDGGGEPGVKPVSGGWEFTAPSGDALTKRILDTLARFQRTGDDIPIVKLTSSVHTADLRAEARDANGPLPGLLNGVVDRYLHKNGYPRKGDIALGWASAGWKRKT